MPHVKKLTNVNDKEWKIILVYMPIYYIIVDILVKYLNAIEVTWVGIDLCHVNNIL